MVQVRYILGYLSNRYNQGGAETPRCLRFTIEWNSVGFITVILPGVRDRFWGCELKFIYGQKYRYRVTYGSVTVDGCPSSTRITTTCEL
jgi:hypothetical protein